MKKNESKTVRDGKAPVSLKPDTEAYLKTAAARLGIPPGEYLQSIIMRDLEEAPPITTIRWTKGEMRRIHAMAARLGIDEINMIRRAVNQMIQFVLRQPDHANLLTEP